MNLDDFRERRARVRAVMSVFNDLARVSLQDVEIRSAPTREPGRTGLTVTPTGDGRWRGDSWYSEAGGNHSIQSVIATTPEKVLDWVWWSCTASYRESFVVPAELQHDREVRRILRDLLKISSGDSEMRSRMQEGARPQWSDESTNTLALGLAARMLARSPSATAMRLARNPRTPTGALATMASTGVPAVRWQIAGNPATNAKTLERLHASDDFGIRWYLAARDDTTTRDIVAWAAEDPALWSAALDRPDLTADQLDEIDQASSGALRTRISGHPAAARRSDRRKS